MAHLIDSPTGSGPQGAFEQQVVAALLRRLPEDYLILPNFSIREKNGQGNEYDVVVLAPHAVYVIEAKEWLGRLSGDDSEWLLNQTPRRCPLWLVERKGKVLKSSFGALGNGLWVEPVLVVPDGIRNDLAGQWAKNLTTLSGLCSFLQDQSRVRFTADVKALHRGLTRILEGGRGKRLRSQHRRVGNWELQEPLHIDDDHSEHRARHALMPGGAMCRIRLWPLHPYLDPAERQRRVHFIQRSTQAVTRIGRHPNLLPILDFSFLEDDNLFYEVTEWSDFGTLHGYLKNQVQDRLTLRERLEIATGVTNALVAVHAQGVVHRNLCPETILVGFDRQPRLTDFDRAFIEDTQTVFAATERRRRNPAYTAPELRDSTDYDFDSCADLYSLGVLLFELLTDQIPGAEQRHPRALRAELDGRLDALTAALLNAEDFHARPSAEAALAELRAVLGTTAEQQSKKKATHKEPGSDLAIGDIIDGQYRIDGLLGTGFSSRVYRVFHLDQGKSFAMKLLMVDQQAAELVQREYNQIGSRLPIHPHIARMHWMGRLAPPDLRPYILSEFIDGETLAPYCDPKSDKRLSMQDIRRVGCEVLLALAAFHPRGDEERPAARAEGPDAGEAEERPPGILHRDIKPANILLELPRHRAKLIDFNVASSLKDARGRAGTPRYWAPDAGRALWRPHMDLFSLGVVLYELSTQLHPFPNDSPTEGTPFDARDLRPDLHLSEAWARFLLRAVAPDGAARFQSADEMREALLAIPSFHAPASQASPSQQEGQGLTLLPEEIGRQNYNPYVTRLLTLHSQARRSNQGTRGLTEIARLTYVNTRMDELLVPRIAAGEFRLVLITGNAGDGKTAFLQKVEEYFHRHLGVAVTRLSSDNGARFSHQGRRYESNYDGSQDEGDAASDEVLGRFFAPFADGADDAAGRAALPGLAGAEVRLIAINEGRLLDFLLHGPHKDRFAALRRFVVAALHGEAEPPAGALLVNLNLRAVAAGGSASLVEEQLKKLLEPRLWAPCEGCAHRDACPLHHNAASLADPISGAAVRQRLRRLFEVVHLRRRMHITMRDLRSALSFVLLRDHGCEDVAALLARSGPARDAAILALYYPEALATRPDDGDDAAEGQPPAVEDRLVRLLREADVGLVNEPQLDGRLDHDPRTAVPWMSFERRSPFADQLHDAEQRSAPRGLDDLPLAELLAVRRARLARLRRWAYFERRDEGWRDMLPYRSLRKLEDALLEQDEAARQQAFTALRDQVLEAISLSEGLRSAPVRRQHLALRVSRVRNPTVRSYRLFPLTQFQVVVPRSGAVGEVLEFAPDAIEIHAVGAEPGAAHTQRARLRISLDLLEMLELIRSGYRPSLQDLQGLFVNLQIFRNELLSVPFHHLLLTPDDEELYEVSATTAGGVIGLRLATYVPAGTSEAQS